MRLRGEVSQWDRDLLLDVLAHHLDVVLQLSRDGDDRRALGDSAFDETKDLEYEKGSLFSYLLET